MGKVINFRQAGKRIAKIKRAKKASEKRAEYGRKKPVRAATKKEKKPLGIHLVGHKTNESSDRGEG